MVPGYFSVYRSARGKEFGVYWVAHDLTYDLVSTGPTPKEAMANLMAIREHYMKYAVDRNLPVLVVPAPKEFWPKEADMEKL